MDILLYILGIFAVIVGIALSIGLHELGHYLPAKKFGVRVKQFMVGFGPTVKSWRSGETEFGFKAIPLGGYILMTGMYPPEKKPYRGLFSKWINEARAAEREDILDSDKGRQFYELAPYKKLIIMLGGPVMNLILGTVLLTITLSGIGVTQVSTTIDQVSRCVPATVSAECQASDVASPALAAGLKAGDKILAINGKALESWSAASDLIKASVANELRVRSSGGVESTLMITPVTAQRPVIENGAVKLDANGNPVLGPKPVLGIILASETRALSLGESLAASGQSVMQVGQMILHLPEQVAAVGQSTFGTEVRKADGPVSVIGIGQIAGEVASSKTATFEQKLQSELGILASLNFALFAFNLLPLLPLDGGHVAGGIYEAIKKGIFRVLRKPKPGPADTALLMPLTWVVFILLMAMSALIIIADFTNPISF